MPVANQTTRREDYRMLTGQAHYVDDIKFDDLEYLTLLRSPYPHAKILNINLDAAKRKAGVDLVLTGEDTPNPMPIQISPPGMKQYRYYPLAREKVRYVGEPVAALVAKSPGLAEDAIELIEVEYETLPPVASYEKALQPDAPLVNAECGSNLLWKRKVTHGDVNSAFAQAPHKLSMKLKICRQTAVPIEPRGVVAKYESKEGRMHVWLPSKNPHTSRRMIAQVLQLEEKSVHVTVPEIGGGFGVKGSVYPEDIVTCLASLRLGKPVKWIETRQEDFLATYHGRDQVHEVEAAFDRDGRILAFRDKFYCDVGAPGIMSINPGSRSIPLLTGCYKVPNLEIETKWVATNKAPVGPVRGNGRPEAIFVIERVLDAIAHELALDPAKVRLKNLLTPADLPYDTHLGSKYDSGDFPEVLNKVLAHANYDQLLYDRDAARKSGRYIGVGIACYIEDTGFGSSESVGRGGFESAYVSVNSDGTVNLLCGASPHGQGLETTLSQVCSEELEIPIDRINVVFGDTDRIPEGTGTFASRSLVVAGSAVKKATQMLREKMIAQGAKALGVREAEVSYAKGRVTLHGRGDKLLDLSQLAESSRAEGTPLEASCKYNPPAYTYSSGAHLAVVELDHETGALHILRYVAGDDCGRILNRTIVDGQTIGGIAHGISNALLEELIYDENAQLLTTSFMDYAIPTTMEMPRVELVSHETPSTMNPLGAKGAGEGGTIAALATIANAVSDALAPFGVEVTEVPLTPQRVWNLINKTPRSNE